MQAWTPCTIPGAWRHRDSCASPGTTFRNAQVTTTRIVANRPVEDFAFYWELLGTGQPAACMSQKAGCAPREAGSESSVLHIAVAW